MDGLGQGKGHVAMDFNLIRATQIEHEQRNRSLRPVSEFGEHGREVEAPPNWFSRHVGQLLYTLGTALAALGEQMRQDQTLHPHTVVESRTSLQAECDASC